MTRGWPGSTGHSAKSSPVPFTSRRTQHASSHVTTVMATSCGQEAVGIHISVFVPMYCMDASPVTECGWLAGSGHLFSHATYSDMGNWHSEPSASCEEWENPCLNPISCRMLGSKILARCNIHHIKII